MKEEMIRCERLGMCSYLSVLLVKSVFISLLQSTSIILSLVGDF